jgi:hypothetical protein
MWKTLRSGKRDKDKRNRGCFVHSIRHPSTLSVSLFLFLYKGSSSLIKIWPLSLFSLYISLSMKLIKKLSFFILCNAFLIDLPNPLRRIPFFFLQAKDGKREKNNNSHI